MGREASVFFSEEKNQKTFLSCAHGHMGAAEKVIVFCFFSPEKKAFLP
jgi:hypothetical protein